MSSTQGETVTTRIHPRLGAASGALFSLVLFAGSGHSSSGEVVRELIAIILFLPFLAYLCSLLREAEGPDGWLWTTAFAAGLAGVTAKLLTGVPVMALQHVAAGTPLHKALDNMASASSEISLYPLAVLLTAIAALTFRTHVLPRWLGFGAVAAALAAAAYAVYGSFHIDANFGPALLLWALWTLSTSIVLLRRTRGGLARIPKTNSAVHA
jgi:hypothetical protein